MVFFFIACDVRHLIVCWIAAGWEDPRGAKGGGVVFPIGSLDSDDRVRGARCRGADLFSRLGDRAAQPMTMNCELAGHRVVRAYLGRGS